MKSIGKGWREGSWIREFKVYTGNLLYLDPVEELGITPLSFTGDRLLWIL